MEGNFKDNLAQVNGLGTQITRVENWQKCGMRKAGNKIQKIKVHLPTTPLPTFPSPRRPNTELNYKAEKGGSLQSLDTAEPEWYLTTLKPRFQGRGTLVSHFLTSKTKHKKKPNWADLKLTNMPIPNPTCLR